MRCSIEMVVIGGPYYVMAKNLRKLNIQDRRSHVAAGHGSPDLLDKTNPSDDYLALADSMIENAIGIHAIPLGVATGFVIDGHTYSIPMATEEPSVIAGASFAATLVGRHRGFITTATAPVMAFQVFLEGSDTTVLKPLLSDIETLLNRQLVPLAIRRGGLRDITLGVVPEMSAMKIQVTVDVRDAMGANMLNTCAEQLGALVTERLGLKPLMCILTNSAEQRRATATCTLPPTAVATLCQGRFSPEESVRRLVLAGELAQYDRDRAVTHNKGIMNGITALSLATGNDTRAIEAAAHAWAARTGTYRSLSWFEITRAGLTACLELPLPLATVGGATQHHPTSRFALDLLGQPDSPTLARIAAAVGLAQNLAALCALISTGIQYGHMPLHAKKQKET
ncbi:hydroxymethylglutaryl-CoA reductase, degradative [Planctomycetota bacterium]